MLKVLLVVLAAAVAIYVTVRFIEKRGAAKRAVRPLSPDDDTEFLRRIEWEQAKERKRRRDASGSGDANPGGGTGGDTPRDNLGDNTGDSGSDGGGGGGE